MSTEPIRLPLNVILEINAALIAGHRTAATLHDQQMNDPLLGYDKGLHLEMLNAKAACLAFDVWVVRKLPDVEMAVAE